jgi:UDP-3-O-[3-hydroxymyristoyl] glucosamine N-acyltransferase
MTTLYLCGAGNPEGIRLAVIVNRAQKRWDRLVILDDNPAKHGLTIMGVNIEGPFSLLEKAEPGRDEAANMVARTTTKRMAALKKIQQYGLAIAPLIDPRVDIEGVKVTNDITIYQNVSFCASGSMGEGSVALTGSIVGHGCKVGPCCVIAPGAVINARVEMGEGVYLGTNASILPDLKIGAWATIGANTAVVQNVPPGATVMGVPAQILMMNDAEASPAKSNTPQNPEIRSEAMQQLRKAQQEFLKSQGK